jgi:hypothetical protein
MSEIITTTPPNGDFFRCLDPKGWDKDIKEINAFDPADSTILNASSLNTCFQNALTQKYSSCGDLSTDLKNNFDSVINWAEKTAMANCRSNPNYYGSSNTWLIILIVILVLIGAGVGIGVFFAFKK